MLRDKGISEPDAAEIARMVFEGTGYSATEEDIRDLAETVMRLEERGLGKLNDRLKQGGRGIWDTFAEINVACMLVSRCPPEAGIEYEPRADQQRPADFRIVIGPKTYWLQVKRLAELERDNRQNKIIDRITKCAKAVQVPKFFNLSFARPFGPDRIPDLVRFLSEKAPSAREWQKQYFPCQNDAEVVVQFWPPKRVRLSHLTLGISGDAGAVNVTGCAKEQIRKSLMNAAGAFHWPVNDNTINLVLVDADGHEDIDISEAVYGTEVRRTEWGPDLPMLSRWARQDDGLFQEEGFSKKVTGVLAMRRKERKPICSCDVLLFISETFQTYIENICELLPVDKVFHCNMFPFPEDDNFKLR